MSATFIMIHVKSVGSEYIIKEVYDKSTGKVIWSVSGNSSSWIKCEINPAEFFESRAAVEEHVISQLPEQTRGHYEAVATTSCSW